VLCTSAAEAARAAAAIGFPVVVKGCSAELLHKSDAGLVHLGLRSEAQVRSAHRAVIDASPVPLDGVLVSAQVTGSVETVVGVSTDELFGPTVMFGLGGVFVEVLGDVTFRVPPFDRDEARRMVAEVRGAPLLNGVRGRPAADVRALVDVIMKVQRLAVENVDTVAELDINPLAVLPRGATALDALVALHPTSA
jgi:acetate---CoA ligase (ADP-forming)